MPSHDPTDEQWHRSKRHRRIATRYEKRACFFGGMLTITFVLIRL